MKQEDERSESSQRRPGPQRHDKQFKAATPQVGQGPKLRALATCLPNVCVSVCLSLCATCSIKGLEGDHKGLEGDHKGLEGDQHLLDLLDERIRGDLGDQELRKLCS